VVLLVDQSDRVTVLLSRNSRLHLPNYTTI